MLSFVVVVWFVGFCVSLQQNNTLENWSLWKDKGTLYILSLDPIVIERLADMVSCHFHTRGSLWGRRIWHKVRPSTPDSLENYGEESQRQNPVVR